jgi:tetratricopeptide (TPR) repeat protein
VDDESSTQYATAQEELQAAREQFVAAQLKEGKALLDAGKPQEALPFFKAVVGLGPRNPEAEILLKQATDQVTGAAADAGAAPVAAREPAPAPTVARPSPAVAREAPPARPAPEPERPAQTGKGGPDEALAKGLAAYRRQSWSEAEAALEPIANGQWPAKFKAKANQYLSALRDLQTALDQAKAAGGGAKAARQYRKAYSADKQLDGSHGSFLIGKLVAAYVELAEQEFAARRYVEARDAVDEAMNYDPENARAQAIQQKCINEASKILQEAKTQMKNGSVGTARDKARQVMGILPPLDPRHAEAKAIFEKASASQAGGDESD